MSAEIVNLNQYRKQRQKSQKQDDAAANRRKFGRTKSEKRQDDKVRGEAEKSLDGKEMTPEPSGDDRGKPA